MHVVFHSLSPGPLDNRLLHLAHQCLIDGGIEKINICKKLMCVQ